MLECWLAGAPKEGKVEDLGSRGQRRKVSGAQGRAGGRGGGADASQWVGGWEWEAGAPPSLYSPGGDDVTVRGMRRWAGGQPRRADPPSRGKGEPLPICPAENNPSPQGHDKSQDGFPAHPHATLTTAPRDIFVTLTCGKETKSEEG